MAERNYTAGTRAALFAFCGGTCYWPGCREPVLRLVGDEYIIALQICHIYGLNPTSARHDPTMPEDQLNAFSNLIFLCHPHHVVVDRTHVADFPPDELLQWKRQRESGGQAQLQGLRNVTEQTLQNLITDVYAQQNQRLEDTLRRLEDKDDEAVALIRELQEEIRQLRASGPLVDLDAAAMLSRAASQLMVLPDSASALSRAANDVAELQDTVSALERVARDINRMRDMM
jgi:hypothetical protein